MTEEQIKHMVDRFLGWRLPENFRPDAGISFKASFNENTPYPMKHEPVGTNLLDATQATAMVRYMLEGLPENSNTAILDENHIATVQGILEAIGDLQGVWERVDAYMRGRGVEDPLAEIEAFRKQVY